MNFSTLKEPVLRSGRLDITQGLTIKTIKWTIKHHERQADRTLQHGNNTRRPSREKRPFRRVTKVNVSSSQACSGSTGTTSRREWYSHDDLDRCGPRMPPTSRRRTCCINRRSCPARRNAQRDDLLRTPPGLSRRVVVVHRDDVCVRVEQALGALFCGNGRNGIRITSTATIDGTGMGDCFLVCGSSDRTFLEASIKRAMKSYDDVGVRAVFCFDSYSIRSLSTG